MANTSKGSASNSRGRTTSTTNASYKKASTASSNSRNRKVDDTYTKARKVAAVNALSEEDESDIRRNEILLFVYLAIAVFVILSNFGLCGFIGRAVSGLFFGLVGTVSYILPFYVFLSAAFILSNGAKKKLVKRVLCVGIFLVVIAFICQLLNGASDVTIRSLYHEGASNKRGGGLLLGGILALLYKLIGMSGSIILIVLLTIIGIIIVLDVSIVDMVKNSFNGSFYDDDDDEYDDDDYTYDNREKNKNLIHNIKVLESDNPKRRKKGKKRRNSVNAEDVHELKPLPNVDPFDNSDLTFESDMPKAVTEGPVDFFAKTESDLGTASDIMNEAKEEAVLEPVKRRRKKTKESYSEMVAERDSVAASISGVSATAATSSAIIATNSASTADIIEKPAVSPKTSEKAPERVKVANTSDNATVAKEYLPENYIFPPVDLLQSGKGKGMVNNDDVVRETAIKLKSTLETFGVKVAVTDYSCGPAVTRYELSPEQGVKVSKIVNLADDIKLNLAAADIRIEAPIPGKAAIGIEIPNKESQPVFFRDLLESDEFKKFSSKIGFAVGKDISGQVVCFDIAKMPHLLVAGATGSGKSVCINTLIMSILYKARPDEVKLIMVDPKQVELSVYNGIPHMLIPVVTDPKKAAGALNWAVMEMTNRYQLFAQYNVRNLQGYNEKVEQIKSEEPDNEEMQKLPQIVIIVDELADLMMVAHGEVEDAIVRLSQLARAAGIHLIIATQRPSVDVITGLIKANVPSRIAMKVSSGVDSRTILDMVGAEKLLGNGDMLFYPNGYSKPVRVQGAFLKDEEIVDVVEFIKQQSGDVKYDTKITDEIEKSNVGAVSGAGGAESEYDDYFADAGKFIIGKDKASIGMLQRVYKIGFNRAARIMDQLSEVGVVGPEEGTKPRKVLMTMEEFENFVEENL